MAGLIVNKLKDGYNNIKAFDLCFIFSIFTCITGIGSAFFSDIIYFIIFVWIAFFFGGAIMPILTGIIITSLPQHLRASGNSLQLFFGNLLGYLPAPYIYGALQDLFKDGGKRSYFFNQIFLFISMVLLSQSRRLKYEKKEDLENTDNNFMNAIYNKLILNDNYDLDEDYLLNSSFENDRSDFNIMYTDNYGDTVMNDMLSLEIKLLIEKMMDIQKSYHK